MKSNVTETILTILQMYRITQNKAEGADLSKFGNMWKSVRLDIKKTVCNSVVWLIRVLPMRMKVLNLYQVNDSDIATFVY